MTARRHAIATTTLLAVLLCILASTPATAQYVTFPRLGLSAAPDHYEPSIDVEGLDPFDVYVIVLPAEGEPTLEHDYLSFHWGILESCCGGAATIVGEDYAGNCTHEGSLYTGVTTVANDCLTGDSILLCTVSLQMTLDQTGEYFVIGGPFSLAYDCDEEGVLMTDMILYVNYTTDTTPVGEVSLSDVKKLFR